MSRSYWHTPIKANAGQNCSKEWRSKQNRKYRAYCKNRMRHEEYELPSYTCSFGNEWDSPRDGRNWCGESKYKQCPVLERIFGYWRGCDKRGHRCYKYYKELMRK